MADVGELKIGLAFDKGKFKASQDSVEKDTKSWGSKIGGLAMGAGKAVAAGAVAVASAAGAAVVKITKDAVTSFAEYQQLVGGVETLFKDSADQVMGYAQKAYKTAGLSANQYMNTVTSFSASLLQGLGGDTKKAAEYGNRAVIDMADNANKMGTDISLIQNAYQGFAKQNYTMLDNLKLGYGGTKTEMERLLKRAEELTGKKFDVSNFADITEAIHVIQENMGIAGTTAKEAETTISGSLNMVKASWQNVLNAMADPEQDINKVLDELVKSFGVFAKNIIPTITKTVGSIGKMIQHLAPVIGEELPKMIMEVGPPIINAIVAIVEAIAQQLGPLLDKLLPIIADMLVRVSMAIVQAAPQILQALLTASVQIVQQLAQIIPTLIPQIVTAVMEIVKLLTAPQNLQMLLQAAIQLFMAIIMAIPDIIVALADAIPTIIDNIVAFISNPQNIIMLLNAAVKIFMALVMAIPKVLPKLISAVGSLISAIPRIIIGYASAVAGAFSQIIQKGVDKVRGFFTKMKEAAGHIITGLVKGLGNGVKAVVNKIKEICKGALGAIKKFFGIESPSKVMAQMGDYMMQGLSKGIDRSADGVVDSMNQASQDIMASANADLGSGLSMDYTADSNIERSILANVTADNFSGSAPVNNFTINMNNNINSKLDAQEIGQLMMTSIRRAS